VCMEGMIIRSLRRMRMRERERGTKENVSRCCGIIRVRVRVGDRERGTKKIVSYR
jgi:hypothetical protein